MPLQLPDRVWMLAERLYIHGHSADDFRGLLTSQGIDYPGVPYAEFNTLKGRYTFFSEPSFVFAQFMRGIPSHKYLALLEYVVFEEEAKKSANDNWNYYGERIKNWYPELLELLALAGVAVDNAAKRLVQSPIESLDPTPSYLAVVFSDPFIDHIREETNGAYASQHFLSVSFLARKLLEVVVIRLFEVVFPKIASGNYSESNHDLWYDKARGQYRGFGELLDNLNQNAASFHEDKDLVITFVGLVQPLRKATNVCVHVDYARPDADYLRTYRVPYIVELSHRLFRKYCNP